MTPAKSPQFDAFVTSLAAAAPPRECTSALRGVWHALRGEWAAAHDAVQPDGVDCAWVHAALHREEGDHENARYWYRLARRSPGMGTLRDEYLAIARDLLAAS